MNLFALPSFVSFVGLIFLGSFVFLKGPDRALNRIFLFLCLAAAFWALTEYGYRQAENIETAGFWLRLNGVVFIIGPLILHLVLVFRGDRSVLGNKLVYPVLYVPALVVMYLYVGTDVMGVEPVRHTWGWTYSIPRNALAANLSYSWLSLMGILSLYLTVRYYLKETDHRRKQQAKFLAIGFFIGLAVGLVSEWLLPEVNVDIPELSTSAFTVCCAVAAYAIWRYQLFSITPETAAEGIISTMPDCLLVADPELKVTLTNRAALQMLGYQEKELIGQPVRMVLSGEGVAPAVVEAAKLDEDAETVIGAEAAFLTKTKTSIPVSLSRSVMRDSEGNAQGVIYICRDITERKQAEDRIQHYMKRIEALYSVGQAVSQTLEMDELLRSALNEVVKVMGADIGFVYQVSVSERALVLRARTATPAVDDTPGLKVELSEGELQRVLQWTHAHTSLSEVLDRSTLGLVGQANEQEQVESFAAVPLPVKGKLQGVLCVSSLSYAEFGADDMDLLRAIGNEIGMSVENAVLLERTRELSITDELTGLYNRRHFYEVLEGELSRTQRYGDSFSLVMLDLDGFKEYNDTYGHATGDAVLRSVARALISALRESDSAFRYGGDEFTIILPIADADTARTVVERVGAKWLEVLKEEHLVLEKPLGFSGGVAQFPKDAATADALVSLADSALYHSKSQGGYRLTLASNLATLSTDASRHSDSAQHE